MKIHGQLFSLKAGNRVGALIEPVNVKLETPHIFIHMTKNYTCMLFKLFKSAMHLFS